MSQEADASKLVRFCIGHFGKLSTTFEDEQMDDNGINYNSFEKLLIFGRQSDKP